MNMTLNFTRTFSPKRGTVDNSLFIDGYGKKVHKHASFVNNISNYTGRFSHAQWVGLVLNVKVPEHYFPVK